MSALFKSAPALLAEDDSKQQMVFHFLPKDDANKAHQFLWQSINEMPKPSPDGKSSGSKEAVPSLMLHQAVRKNGGFTVKDHLGDAPKSGYMVSLNKSSERSYRDNELKPQHIEAYRQQHAAELKQPGAHLGGWHDPNTKKVYLDVSQHFNNLDHAMQAAKRGKQLAIYDLKAGKSIYTNAPKEGIVPLLPRSRDYPIRALDASVRLK